MVRFYSQVIFPRLCDLLLNRPQIAKHRRDLLFHAFGHVVEIGFGTGLNLPHYPRQVGKLIAVDPNPGMHQLAHQRLQKSAIAVEHQIGSGTQLPCDDNTVDCVVSTFTLCSIDDPAKAIAEAYRVLRPGGRFLCLEHGLSPEPAVQRWQRRLNWLEMRCADGCRLDRNIRVLLAGQPFGPCDMAEFYLEKTPRTHGYLYRGIANK